MRLSDYQLFQGLYSKGELVHDILYANNKVTRLNFDGFHLFRKKYKKYRKFKKYKFPGFKPYDIQFNDLTNFTAYKNFKFIDNLLKDKQVLDDQKKLKHKVL
jgi:hypothetical protein